MGIGTGVVLIALGAVLSWAIDIDLPYVDDDGLGMILVFAGIAALLISVILRADHPGAGVGTGVALIAAGAVLAWAIDVDVPFITDSVFGGILIVAGVIALAGVGAVNAQHRRAARNAGYGQPAPNGPGAPGGQPGPYGQQGQPRQGGYPPPPGY